MRDYDLAIVGAGPAGSNAARVALGAGLKVAQFDRAAFPRVKPCAGALTTKALRAIEFEVPEAERGRSQAVEFSSFGRMTLKFRSRDPLLRFVFRPQFDDLLVERNLSNPQFHFYPAEAVQSIVHQRGRFEIHTVHRIVSCRQVIGADGAYGIVNRCFPISSPVLRATAVEVVLPRGSARLDESLPPVFDFEAIRQGYGWVFPKDDHWSVGLYTLAPQIRGLKKKLARYIEAKGFEVDQDPLANFEAHRYPVGVGRLNVPRHPVYLTGDAAGVAEAITGEGIYSALVTGSLAARTAVAVARGESSHRRYYARLRRSVLRDSRLSARLAGRILTRPAFWLAALSLGPLWRPFIRGYAEGAPLAKCLAFSAYYLIRSPGRDHLKIVHDSHTRR